MQRYEPEDDEGCAGYCMAHDNGDYVLHSDAQAEIARLQAEVERLRGECKRKGYEIEMHSSLAEHARQQLDTAHNDAIEAAATVKTEDGYELVSRVTATAIRSLKRP